MDDEEASVERDKHWHVTRGIPLASIAAMAIIFITQIVGATWFASAMTYRIETVERVQTQMAPMPERVTRIEEKLVALQTGISDIKVLLQKPSR